MISLSSIAAAVIVGIVVGVVAGLILRVFGTWHRRK